MSARALERRPTPREWARRNLFGSRLDTVLTVVFTLLFLWVAYRLGRFVLVDARWEIVERNITNLMVGGFPRDQISRLWAALFVLAAALGFGAGAFGAQRRREVAEGRAVPMPRGGLRRLVPLFVLVAGLLWFARSFEPVLLVVAIFALGYVCNLLGQRVPARFERFVPLIVLAGVLAAFLVVASFGGVGWNRWGGFILTIFLAVAAILLSFPFGVLLALGRRSSLRAVRYVCIGYIEFFRGVPLITILFMAFFMIGFILPEGVDPPSLVTRAIIGFTLFTSAYIAEIVRGGLQSVPTGQVEAAQALGLSPWKTTRRIVLPQALRAVIPGIVGQFISL
jgi:general L-amino acid transport system permease protein